MEYNKKIKILHIAQAAGGVDRYLQCLIKYMDRDKFENILVCSYDYNQKDYEGIIDDFQQVEMGRSIGPNDIKAIFAVRKLIKKYKPDIVYAHSSKAGVVGRMADIFKKNKCIYNPHGWAFNMNCSRKKQNFYSFIEKLMVPFSDKIVCISDAERDSALKRKIAKEKKLKVIFNGVDVKEFEDNVKPPVKREELNIPEDAFVVGMVGRISQQKAPDIFIRMANELKDKIPNLHLVIVGDGEMKDEILSFAEKNGLSDSLHIAGWVDNPLSYVKTFDIAVLLSRWEGFGLAIPEYMMAEKPVVATNIDAIPNIVKDGENGLLVPVDDYKVAAEKVMELYNNKSVREQLVKKGKKDVYEKFDARRVSKEHSELFSDILNNGE